MQGSPLFFSKNMHYPQRVEDHKQHDEDNTSMPEEAQDQVSDMYDDMQKIAKNHEGNDEPSKNPDPGA